jgi:hypothetical protein
MLTSAVVGGQFVAGKAARDALFLANVEASSLPGMIILTAIVSIVLVVAGSKALGQASPASWVPAAFGVAAVRLWPFVEDHRRPGTARRPRQETLAGLLRSNESIRVNLEELKRRAAAARSSTS